MDPTTPSMAKLLEILKEKIKTPSLTNKDLSLIVNGKPSDLPSNSPFVSTFIKDKITYNFCRVGYVTFASTYLLSPYIRHELGEDTEDTTLHDLVKEYQGDKVSMLKVFFMPRL